MKVTKRFHILRSKDLEKVFKVENLVDTWRNVVRSQLRSLDILDLYDYYDFNFFIKSKAALIRRKILDAQYRISQPYVYKLEKKYGVCRHILLLSPSDALTLQTIVDMGLANQLLAAQPTKKSYYSRDGNSPQKLPNRIKSVEDYSWLGKWKKFQKDIWNFSQQRKFLVVTDLANYYDNIGLRELRHIISSYVSVPEVILDLLFNMIEQLSWNPDYLPSSLKGLPTIDMEAPRLLAHALLYEVDEVLNEATDGCFVRWMDDINFGVDSFDDACITLGDTNDVLKSRGLSLNLGKTNIYTSEEVALNFLVDTHDYLDKIEKQISGIEKANDVEACDIMPKEQLEKDLYDCFLSIKSDKHLKRWDKAIKRFMTIFGKLKSDLFLRDAVEIFICHPDIRKNVIFYLQSLDYSMSTAQAVQRILSEARIYDHVALFSLVKLLTEWKVSTDVQGVDFLEQVFYRINSMNKDPMTYYCLIWFAAKYLKPNEIINLVINNEAVWKNNNFIGRQVVSVTPRYIDYRQDLAMNFLDGEITRGVEDSASVASHIKYLRGLEAVPFRLNSYLFPAQRQKKYPLPKYLILLASLGSDAFKNQAEKYREKIAEYLDDPWYIKWIDTYSP